MSGVVSRLRLVLSISLIVTFALTTEFAVAADKNADKPASEGQGSGPDADVGNASVVLDTQQTAKLEALEDHFFGRMYPHEPVDRRILRLERFVFGKEYSGAFPGRLVKLEETLTMVEPDGTKRTVALTKPSPQPQAVAPEASTAPGATEAADGIPSIASMNVADATAGNADVDSKTEYIQKDYKPDAGSSEQIAVAPPMAPVVAAPVKPEEQLIKPNMTPPPPRPKQVVLHVSKDSFPSDGKPQQLIKELTLAIKVHPLDPDLQYQRAKALIQLDKYENALADLSDAIMNQPNKSDYYIARAWVYMKLGNSVLAADDIKQARFVDPGLPAKIDLTEPSRDSASSQ